MINILYTGVSSACFELAGTSPYFAPQAFDITLDGQTYGRSEANVFSVFGLKPDTDHEIGVVSPEGNETITIHTAAESACVNVRDFGAAGDGLRDDTAAIQAAISFVPDGTRVYFPEGTYLSRPLMLRSHITLELAEGARLLGSTDREAYPIIPGYVSDMTGEGGLAEAVFEGNEVPAYQSLLQAAYAEDITIVGLGRIDGNGQNGDWWTGYKDFPAARPRVIFMDHCKGVVLHGVTVCNGPAWHIHPYFTKDFSMLNCRVEAPKVSPNTDAIDPECCDGVKIIGCVFTVGDDCIAVKSGKIDLARKYHTPADHHTIRNCLMEYGHGALTLGSELAGGIRNLSVTQCYFKATDRGLRIKSRRGRGRESLITNVDFDNIRMDRVLTPIVINLWYNCCDPDRFTEYVWSREKLPIDDRTPHMGDFHFRNMECTGAEVCAAYIDGLPESPIDSVTFENISVTFADECRPAVPAMQNFAVERCRMGLYLDNVRRVVLKNVSISGQEGSALITDHCDEIHTEEF